MHLHFELVVYHAFNAKQTYCIYLPARASVPAAAVICRPSNKAAVEAANPTSGPASTMSNRSCQGKTTSRTTQQ